MHSRLLSLVCLIAVSVPACTWAEESEDRRQRAPLSFGLSKASPKTNAFGAQAERSERQETSDRDKTYARGLMKKYDSNKNRVLEESEWKKIRGNPEKADTNGDKRVTYDELVNRIMRKRRETEATEAGKKAEDAPRSYRIATPLEKLPEGLPGWFDDKDADGDGQVAMYEYSRRWTDSTARRFVALDENDDGVITADEAAAKK